MTANQFRVCALVREGAPMPRTDDDTWDLASSVGATATMVAAARALASSAEDAVIDDPFAAPLVRAVGVEFFRRMIDREIPSEVLDVDGSGTALTRFTDAMAARTRFFDDFFLAAGQAGIRQAVILAAGLDARAYRLRWPDGTVVYEIDQPRVIEFKTRTLARLGAEPTAERRTVAADLRHDWPAALTAAGFDPAAPTVWIAEGLFGYLPPDAQDRLLDQITDLSAVGSRLGVEGVPAHADADEDEVRQRMRILAERWRAHGLDLDFSELIYLGDRADVAGYLADRGWRCTALTANELLVRTGLPPAENDGRVTEVVYLSSEKSPGKRAG